MPRLLMIIVVVTATRSTAAAEDKSWVGESVMPAKPEVRFVTRSGDNEISFKPMGVVFPVLKEQEGWLRLRDENAKEGWGEKKDFVLLQDAPAHYTDLMRQNEKNIWALGTRGQAWTAKGELENAIKDLSEFIRLDPKNAAAYSSRGIVWNRKKDHENAIKDYTEAIRLDPRYSSAFNNRGMTWQDLKKYDKATQDYEEAIRIEPNDSNPVNNLAWLTATCQDAKYRDGMRAVTLATKACEMTDWKEPNCIDTLAAAYAEAGDFKQAIKCQNQTLEFAGWAKANGDNARKRIKMYEQKQPYRE